MDFQIGDKIIEIKCFNITIPKYLEGKITYDDAIFEMCIHIKKQLDPRDPAMLKEFNEFKCLYKYKNSKLGKLIYG